MRTSLARVLDALADRAADAIVEWVTKPKAERPKELVVDVDFEDVPQNALPAHRKARRRNPTPTKVPEGTKL